MEKVKKDNDKVKAFDGQEEYDSYIFSLTNEVAKLNVVKEKFTEIVADTNITVDAKLVFGLKSALESAINSYILSQPKQFQGHLVKYYKDVINSISIPIMRTYKHDAKDGYKDLTEFVKLENGTLVVDNSKVIRKDFDTYIDKELNDLFSEHISTFNRLVDRFGKEQTPILLDGLKESFDPKRPFTGKMTPDKIGTLCKNLNL